MAAYGYFEKPIPTSPSATDGDTTCMLQVVNDDRRFILRVGNKGDERTDLFLTRADAVVFRDAVTQAIADIDNGDLRPK